MRPVLGILLLALVVRAALLAAWFPGLEGDAREYDRLAATIAAGGGYATSSGVPTSWRPPLYPAFLASVYALGGSASSARWLQAVVDTGSVMLVMAIAWRTMGERAGRIAGLLAAVNVAQIAVTGRILSETLFVFLLLAVVRLTVALVDGLARREPASRTILVASGVGALLGLAALTRGTIARLPPLIAAALVWPGPASARAATRGPAGRRVLTAAVVVLAFALVLSPWALRNYRVHGRLVPVTTQIGITLYSSYFPPEDRIFGVLARDATTRHAARLPEAEADRFLTRATLERIAGELDRLPRLVLLKVLYYWTPLDWEILPVYGAVNATYILIVLLAAAWVIGGGWRQTGGERHRVPRWPVWVPVLCLFGVAVVFYGSPRMRLPAEPLLAVFAGGGTVLLEDRLGRKLVWGTVGGFLLGVTLWGAVLKRAAVGLLGAVGLWG